MQEKVLVRSRIKCRVLVAITAILSISVVIITVLLTVLQPRYYTYDSITKKVYEEIYANGFEAAAYGEEGCKLLLKLLWMLLPIEVILIILCVILKYSELVITDRNVRAKWLFGIETVLPLYKVTSYGTSALFNAVWVYTCSSKIRFICVENYQKFSHVLDVLINERQRITEVSEDSISN